MSAEPYPMPICGAIKLVGIGLVPMIGSAGGATQVAMTCVRKAGHPEREDSSLHLCGTFAWAIGPGDDYLEAAR